MSHSLKLLEDLTVDFQHLRFISVKRKLRWSYESLIKHLTRLYAPISNFSIVGKAK